MIKYKNTGITNAFYEAMMYDDYDSPKGWSPSSLTSPPYLLKLRKEAYENDEIQIELPIEKRVHLFVGQAYHAYAEKSNFVFTEKRLFVEFEGEIVSAKFDLYDPRDNSIQDFKSVGKNSAFDKDELTVKEEYQAQLNINAYIFRKHGLPVKKLYINYIFKDFMVSDKYSNRPPNSPVQSGEVEMWSDEKVEAYIRKKINYHKTYTEVGCSEEERWHTPPKFALMKKGGKRALKLYNHPHEIPTLKENQYVEPRPGRDARCEDYCEVKSICEYYRRTHGES